MYFYTIACRNVYPSSRVWSWPVSRLHWYWACRARCRHWACSSIMIVENRCPLWFIQEPIVAMISYSNWDACGSGVVHVIHVVKFHPKKIGWVEGVQQFGVEKASLNEVQFFPNFQPSLEKYIDMDLEVFHRGNIYNLRIKLQKFENYTLFGSVYNTARRF